MRILYISYENPYFPGGTGGQTRQYSLLKCLAARHEFHFIGLKADDDQLEMLSRVFTKVTLPERTLINRAIVYVARRIPHGYPRFVQELEGQRVLLKSLIRSALKTTKYDLIHVEHTNIAHWLHGLKITIPKIIVAQNVKTVMWKRYAEQATGPEKERLFLDYQRFNSYESRYLAEYDGVVAVSDIDKGLIEDLCGPGMRLFVVPNGVDIDYFSGGIAPIVPKSIVFTGSMVHPPNNEAALHFCQNIWGAILERSPSARLSIVGSSPSAEVLQLAEQKSVTVTGFVDDTRPYLASADVVVVPLLSGSGTRLKIMEAMAMGKAIVSTSIGAEGIEYTDGENILIADDAKIFADKVLELFANPSLRENIGLNGRKLVEEKYSWHILANRLEDIYSSVCSVER